MKSLRRLAFELHRYVAAYNDLDVPGEPSYNDPSLPDKETGSSAASDAVPGSTHRQDELDELTQRARGCERCRLCENRTQVVFGEGDTRARILVIGEAPGAREDAEGRPFVGPAGELLRGTVEKIGLDLNELYITNTVKCRPPDNRDPRDDELDACRSYLDRQIEFIDPPVVLTLGTFALQYCLGSDARISQFRGDVYEWQNRELVPTYHPAYILRNRSRAQAFFDDLKLVTGRLEN